jgi:CubicO group peptidase (beta-lactamase class C family)
MKKTFLFLLLVFSSFLVFSQNLNQDLQQVFDDFQLMGISVWVTTPLGNEEMHLGTKDFTRALPLDSDTKYRVASISKTVTALGLLKLFDEGHFNLDDNINDYLDFSLVNPNHLSTPITFRMLLSHTASIQDGSGYTNFLNATYSQNPIPHIDALLVPGGNFYTANMWRQETPGTHFAYSNLTFGVIATLIEAISQQRFDVYMRQEILMPLGITGSFNIQDIDDINDIAVLYRNQNGWTPQFDNYQGVMPNPPANLPSLTLGTNGLFFSPQGGLRASASELGRMLAFIQTNGNANPGIISEETLLLMKSIAWDYNGTNGDNYFGLFNRWGLGVHHANISMGDRICENFEYGTFIGHPGEAYGLISDAYFSEEEAIGFTFLTNGCFLGYSFGNETTFYALEEAVFEVVCNYFSTALTTEDIERYTLKAYPNPSNDYWHISGMPATENQLKLYDINGKLLVSMVSEKEATISSKTLTAGLYFLKIENSTGVSKTLKLLKN